MLTTHPMRMRILSERSESKDLSSHPTRESVLRSIATKDLSSHLTGMFILPAPSFSGSESAAADESKDLSSHPTRESVLLALSDFSEGRSIASERSELVTSLCQIWSRGLS